VRIRRALRPSPMAVLPRPAFRWTQRRSPSFGAANRSANTLKRRYATDLPMRAR
jgi:hypothetical protein